MENEIQTEVTTPIKRTRKPRTPRVANAEVDYKAEYKRILADLNYANNKIEDLKRIVESMKGQSAQLEQQLKATQIKHKATKEYMLDAVKHAYITLTMAVKEGE